MAANWNPAHQPVGAAAGAVPGRRDPVLDAARVLMLYGVVGAVATVGSGSSSSLGDAIGSLALLLLGVWLLLLAFVPAAGRFPCAALVAAAAALGHLFAPPN